MTKGNFFQKRHLSHQNISMLSHAAEQWADKVFFSLKIRELLRKVACCVCDFS